MGAISQCRPARLLHLENMKRTFDTASSRLGHLLGSATLGVLGTMTLGCAVAQVDAPEITVTRENVEFPGAPVEPLGRVRPGVPGDAGESSGVPFGTNDFPLPPQRFSYDEVPKELPDGMSVALLATHVTVKARHVPEDLTWIRRLLLTVNLPDRPDEWQVVVEYPPREGDEVVHRSEDELVLPVSERLGSVDPWQARGAVFELAVWGNLAKLPRDPWAVDVSVTFVGELHYEYP